MGVACLNGKLYAVGGHDGNQHLNTVECYDPKVRICVPFFIYLNSLYFLSLSFPSFSLSFPLPLSLPSSPSLHR